MTKLQETVDLFKIALENTPPHHEDSIKLVLIFMKMFKDDIGPLYKDFIDIVNKKKLYIKEAIKSPFPEGFIDVYTSLHPDWIDILPYD